jgi:hypothetical protein
MYDLDNLSVYESESLRAFLALPGTPSLIQGTIVASKIGAVMTFDSGAQMFALVAYGEDAHLYRPAVEGVKLTIGLARAHAAEEAA